MLALSFVHDSAGSGLDGYVTRLRTPARGEVAGEMDDMPGAPRAIVVNGARRLLMETPCGDCTSAVLLLQRGKTLASIDISVDDRDGYQPGLMCRLTRVAATFVWARP